MAEPRLSQEDEQRIHDAAEQYVVTRCNHAFMEFETTMGTVRIPVEDLRGEPPEWRGFIRPSIRRALRQKLLEERARKTEA